MSDNLSGAFLLDQIISLFVKNTSALVALLHEKPDRRLNKSSRYHLAKMLPDVQTCLNERVAVVRGAYRRAAAEAECSRCRERGGIRPRRRIEGIFWCCP